MRRLPGIWLRVLIAVILAIIGVAAVTRGLAMPLARNDPVAAMALSWGDARVAGRASERMIEGAKAAADRLGAAKLARRAMERDATVVPAAVTLGTYAGLNNDARASIMWFDYSLKLSRRDLRTQLFFIERSVSQGNVDDALSHYDTALRTNAAKAAPTLFPVLQSAMADPAIRGSLAKILARKPVWANSFLANAAIAGPDYGVSADLFLRLRRLGFSIEPDSDAALLNNLVARKDFTNAWNYYAATRPGARSSIVRNPGFGNASATPSPFDWKLSSTSGVSADLDSSTGGGVLSYQLSPTTGGAVAQQTILLSRGQYRLESVVAASSQAVGSGPYWQIACLDGRTVSTLEIGGPVAKPRRFAANLTIPDNCQVQTLSLVVRSSDDVQGATGQIDMVSISKLG